MGETTTTPAVQSIGDHDYASGSVDRIDDDYASISINRRDDDYASGSVDRRDDNASG